MVVQDRGTTDTVYLEVGMSVKLFRNEMREWIDSHEMRYLPLSFVIDPQTFERVPYEIEFFEEESLVAFLLRWS